MSPRAALLWTQHLAPGWQGAPGRAGWLLPVSGSHCPAADAGWGELGFTPVHGSQQTRDLAQKDPAAELINVIGSNAYWGGMINPTSVS